MIFALQNAQIQGFGKTVHQTATLALRVVIMEQTKRSRGVFIR